MAVSAGFDCAVDRIGFGVVSDEDIVQVASYADRAALVLAGDGVNRRPRHKRHGEGDDHQAAECPPPCA